jgi:hypothetical protein
MPPEKHHDASHGDVHLGPLLLEGSAEPSSRRRLPSSLSPHPNLRLPSQLPSFPPSLLPPFSDQQWRTLQELENTAAVFACSASLVIGARLALLLPMALI